MVDRPLARLIFRLEAVTVVKEMPEWLDELTDG